MLKIGITGGIGSGKSTVCRIFESLNIPIYYADAEASIVTNTDDMVRQKLSDLFGNTIYTSQSVLDKKKLASIIFSDTALLKKVNSIIHPAVFNHYQKWCKIHEEYDYTIKEAAILFESGAYKQVDKVVTVFAPSRIRTHRVMLRENISEEEVYKRMKNQMLEDEKLKRSDFVIYNDESQLLIPQVLHLDKVFRTL